MKEQKKTRFLGDVMGYLPNDTRLLRHKDGQRWFELFPDGTTLILHKVPWASVRLLLDDGSTAEHPYPYYGRLKGFSLKGKNLRRDKAYMTQARKEAFRLNREMWMMILRYCIIKQIPTEYLLVTARLSPRVLFNLMTSEHKLGSSALNLGAVLVALNVDARELLRWHAQHLDYAGMDYEAELQRMLEDLQSRATVKMKQQHLVIPEIKI